MKKEWFFDRVCGHSLVAYTEDGKIVEVGVEFGGVRHALGNIYKGRVANVVVGMQAAFIACGMERNCYLPQGEGVFTTYDGEGTAQKLTLKEGDEVLVQLVKPARGNKGAKVTCDLSFVGKNLIYLPRTDFLGISRKIVDPAVRSALLKEAAKLRAEGEGFIVRTAAEKATKRHLHIEAEYLKRVYRAALEQAQGAPVGTVVYREYDLPIRVMRDCLGGGVTKIHGGDGQLYEKVLKLARMGGLGEKKLSLYTGKRTMFSHYGLDAEICALADPRAELPNGGYIIIDRTEAMTVIDVNTGKYTGESDLESTVYETNLLAAKEIARQVRLRNIGGIVAVDFIDMEREEHRLEANRVLEEALKADRAKCRVLPMSDLCVTLFTRKRTVNDLSSLMLKPCSHCTRQGYVFSDAFMAMQLRSAITDCLLQGYRTAVLELNSGLMEAILKRRFFRDDLESRWQGKRVYMIPHESFHEEQYTIRGENGKILTLPPEAQLLY